MPPKQKHGGDPAGPLVIEEPATELKEPSVPKPLAIPKPPRLQIESVPLVDIRVCFSTIGRFGLISSGH